MPTVIQAAQSQVSQIGVETTPGVAVAATRRLNSMGVALSPNSEVQTIRPPGFKFDTASYQTREWSEGSIAGDASVAYNEIAYPLASLLSTPTITPVIGTHALSTAFAKGAYMRLNGVLYKATTGGTTAATAPAFNTAVGATTTDGTVVWTSAGPVSSTLQAYKMVFDISTFDRDTRQTYTVETGDRDSDRGYRAANAFFSGMTLNSGRGDTVSVDGDLLCNARSSFDLTPAASVTDTQIIPASPAHLNIYMDNSAAALGTTLLDGNMTAEVGLGDRASHVWFHGRNYSGPAGSVETPLDATFELTQADGEEVDAMVASLNSGEKKFFRLNFEGPIIGGSGTAALHHVLDWDVCGNIGDSPSWDEEDDVWAATVPFAMQHDGVWNRATEVTVVSTLAAL